VACSVPIEIMRRCCQIIQLQGEMAEKGCALTKSDAGVGVIFAEAALRGASLNVFVNAKSMKNRERAEALLNEAKAMLDKYCPLADISMQA